MLDIEVQEGNVNDIVFVHLEQPFAVLAVRIILRIIGRVYDPCIGGEFTTASERYAPVAEVETVRCIRYIGDEFQEHLVPEAGVHHWAIRVTNFNQFQAVLVLAADDLKLVEETTLLLLGIDLRKRKYVNLGLRM